MSCTMESSETLFRQNAGSTIDSNNSDSMENSKSTSPIENASAKNSKISESSEDRNFDGADFNRERTVEVNTEQPTISNAGKKKYKTFLDSDSEEEDNSTLTNVENQHFDTGPQDSSLANEINVSEKLDRSQNARRFIDSDSDETESLDQTNPKDDDYEKNKRLDASKRKFPTIIDSDSADEDPPDRPDSTGVDDTKESSSGSKIQTKSGLTDILDSESEYEGNSDRASPSIETKKKKNRKKVSKVTETSVKKSNFNGLVDTDSEEDTLNEDCENAAAPAKKSEKKANRRTGSARSAKDEAMRQIHSETQRLVRNSAVSLPYHVPKQRTLQDFLNRRKLIPSLPEGMSTALKVKMSSGIVSKALEEKEREAETFYKSDEEEEEITCTPLNTNAFDETLCPVDKTGIEETQKILKNDVQNAHNKKEIIQQGGSEIGVPRKLFVADEPLERQISVEGKAEQEDVNEEEEEEEVEKDDDEDPLKLDRRKKSKEAKQGMREGNAPRKLFPSDYDEGVDSPPKDLEIVSSDAPNPEKRATLEMDGAMEAADEGIHSLEKTNESSDSCEENEHVFKRTDSELTEPNANPRCSEALDISETPFMSNREYAKLNEREKLSKARQAVNCTENLEVNASPVTTPAVFGDVIGLPPPSFDEPSSCSKSSTTRKTHVRTLATIQPKLRGSPGMMIDLTNDSKPDRDGVQSLRDRFFKHSLINKPKETLTSVSVMRTEKTADGLNVVQEFLPYKIPVAGFTETELQKPGAKYKRLKMDLIEKMAKKRGEEWELEAQREKENREEEEEEEEYEIDEEEDEELPELDEEEGTTESEPEENDMPVGKKKKKNSTKIWEFADEEAEVSLDETDHEEDEEDEEEDDDGDDLSLRVEKDQDSRQDCSDETEDGANKCRKSRIIEASEDDSNSEDDAVSRMDVGGGKVLERTTTDVDMFAPENNDWSSDNDSEFPPSQILPRDQADARSQLCKTPLTAINALRFVSPITQLTALNTSCHSPKESPANVSSFGSSRVSGSFIDKTPNGIKESPVSCDNDKRLNFQKKLFEDASAAINDDDLLGLCSGKFTGIENEPKNPLDPMAISSQGRVTETQLLGLCSGTFASQISSFDEDKTDKNIHENSNDSCDHTLSSTAVKSKYASLRVKSSSEDENSEDEKAPKHSKRRKVRKLELSDDEGSDDEQEEEEDERDTKTEEKYVDYDSEENEIVVVPKKDIKKVAATFLEAEAELSESEWGSEDEDEKDMDRLEFEEGDDEEIDENRMRDQLGKIHMRRIQDDDQREVRMLQELLFDDGDLHTDGSGRERKFKWKNIDTLGDEDKFGAPDDENGGENGNMLEEESDLAWLNEKLEREKFLEDKTKTNVDEVIEELARDSQVFSLGMKALKKTKSNQTSQKEQLEPIATKPMASRTILDLVDSQSFGSSRTIVRKAVSRGSFLARGDECLARMAVHLKETNTTVIKRANPRNFVFGQMISLDEESARVNENEPGSGDVSLETIKGNKRKSTGSLTPRSTKKARLEKNRPTGKKLY